MSARFGARLRRLRLSTPSAAFCRPHLEGTRWDADGHLSVNALARRARTDPAHVHRLEDGTREPSRSVVLRLADALGCSAYERAVLLADAGFWPWTDADERTAELLVGLGEAVGAGDYRRLGKWSHQGRGTIGTTMATTGAPRSWRNRIVRSGDAALSEITANPANWRTHPRLQADALSSVLADVGYVQQVIINARSGRLVDGHLRVELAASHGETSVPAVWVDLSDDEERLILATLDPIGALAETNRDALGALLGDLTERADALGAMLEQLSMSAGIVPPDVTFREYDEDAADDVKYHECPECSHRWPA
jgi:transcriptional regulator with XRE-family HTH domain